MNKIKVAVIGASGYAGLELVRLSGAASGLRAGGPDLPGISGPALFPNLSGPGRHRRPALQPDPAPEEIAAAAEVVFTAVPHQTAMGMIPAFLAQECKVVDLSADFRFRDVSLYEQWYQAHTAPELTGRGGLRPARTAPG